MRKATSTTAVLILAALSGCGSGGPSGPSTDAEWAVQAKPSITKLENAMTALEESWFGEGGNADSHKYCQDVADAALEVLELPPLPSGGDAQEHLTEGLNTMVSEAEECVANDYPFQFWETLKHARDEIAYNVGAWEL